MKQLPKLFHRTNTYQTDIAYYFIFKQLAHPLPLHKTETDK